MSAAAEKSKHPLVTLRDQLELRRSEVKKALPAHIPVERFERVFLTAVQNNPDLLACERQSLWNALMRAAQDGVLPDGRQGAIVLFKDKAQWLIMIAGILTRFRNSGQFKSIATGIVRDGEPFEYFIDERGEHLRHVPGDGSGKMIKAYALAETKDGGVMIRVMNESEINKRRSASRSKTQQVWNDWTEEMWLKTVLRNLAKRLPMSSDVDELIRRDDDDYDFSEQDKPADPPQQQIKDVNAALEAFAGGEIEPPEDEIDLEEKAKRSMDEVHEAQQQGREARRKGIARKAVPGEYRSVEHSHLAQAWWLGWDEENQEGKS